MVAAEVEGECGDGHYGEFEPGGGDGHGDYEHYGDYQYGLHEVGQHVGDKAPWADAGGADCDDERCYPCENSGGNLPPEEYSEAVDGVAGHGEGHEGEGGGEGDDGGGVAHDFELDDGAAVAQGKEIVVIERVENGEYAPEQQELEEDD